MIAALAASPLILSWQDCAFSQTPDSTEASRTWKAAAAAAAAAPASAKPESKFAASLPTNLVPDDSAPSLALPLAPPPRDTAYEDDDVIAPPRDTSAPIENDPTAMPNNLVTTPIGDSGQSSSTVEIPPVLPAPDTAATDSHPPPINVQAQTAKKSGIDDSLQSAAEQAEIARYQQEQSGPSSAQYRNLQALAAEGDITTPIGLVLREERRALRTGEEADGLLIVSVRKGSPAAGAGLHAFSHGVHDAITGIAMIGSVVSGIPAAMVVVPLMEYMQVGESYDLIIGIDGSRVKNFLDFEDQMRDVQPGELIYFSIVRNGKRLQVAVPVTTALN
ncbi:PDZ domain-containing protein [Candidatus Binatus sp.]|uniref:PDZ domain-containing protein n=1 Tax=Candidatus Binatus sp. TaxID=2811406 RepID=UPI00272D16C7|nr:PDZ domain-containing protein [Candidatus Binatus sp.]